MLRVCGGVFIYQLTLRSLCRDLFSINFRLPATFNYYSSIIKFPSTVCWVSFDYTSMAPVRSVSNIGIRGQATQSISKAGGKGGLGMTEPAELQNFEDPDMIQMVHKISKSASMHHY